MCIFCLNMNYGGEINFAFCHNHFPGVTMATAPAYDSIFFFATIILITSTQYKAQNVYNVVQFLCCLANKLAAVVLSIIIHWMHLHNLYQMPVYSVCVVTMRRIFIATRKMCRKKIYFPL